MGLACDISAAGDSAVLVGISQCSGVSREGGVTLGHGRFFPIRRHFCDFSCPTILLSFWMTWTKGSALAFLCSSPCEAGLRTPAAVTTASCSPVSGTNTAVLLLSSISRVTWLVAGRSVPEINAGSWIGLDNLRSGGGMRLREPPLAGRDLALVVLPASLPTPVFLLPPASLFALPPPRFGPLLGRRSKMAPPPGPVT